MNKKNILVVDDNVEFVESIKEYFSNNEYVDIKYVSYDGEDGIKKIEEHNDIDIVLLDLIMSKKDGFSFLDYLKDNNIEKDIIVMTSFNSDKAIRRVANMDIDYLLIKPFDLKELEEKILNIDINKYIDNKDVKLNLTKLLHELGVPSHIKGYEYIREGIMLLYNDSNISRGITKKLYPEIAEKYNTSVSRVERAIRHAIEVSWNRGNLDLMEEVFGHSVDYDRAKPTNSEFIVTVADKIKLEY